MRRDSTYQKNLNRVILFVFLIAYESLTSIYTYLTPFFGVVFCYLVFNLQKEQMRFSVILAFLYMVFFEVDKGFYPFSFFLFFSIYYKLIIDRIEKILINDNSTVAFFVVSSYLGYYLFNFFIAYLLNHEAPSFGIEYFVYIVVDIMIAIIIF